MTIFLKIFFILTLFCNNLMASEYTLDIFTPDASDPKLKTMGKANIKHEDIDLLCVFKHSRNTSEQVPLSLYHIWQLQQLDSKEQVLQFTEQCKTKSQNKKPLVTLRCLFENTEGHKQTIETYVSCFTKNVFLESEKKADAKKIRFIYEKLDKLVIPKELFIINQNNRLEIMFCCLYLGEEPKKTIFVLSDQAVTEFTKKFDTNKTIYYLGIGKKCYSIQLNKEQKKIIEQVIKESKKKTLQLPIQKITSVAVAASKPNLAKKDGMLSQKNPEGCNIEAINCCLLTETWKVIPQTSPIFEVVLNDHDKATIQTLVNPFYIVTGYSSYFINKVDDKFLRIPDEKKCQSPENKAEVKQEEEEKIIPFYKQYMRTFIAFGGITMFIGYLMWRNK